MTMVEKVGKMAEQLGVDSSLPLYQAVAACNVQMCIDGVGPLQQQVDNLMARLGNLNADNRIAEATQKGSRPAEATQMGSRAIHADCGMPSMFERMGQEASWRRVIVDDSGLGRAVTRGQKHVQLQFEGQDCVRTGF